MNRSLAFLIILSISLILNTKSFQLQNLVAFGAQRPLSLFAGDEGKNKSFSSLPVLQARGPSSSDDEDLSEARKRNEAIGGTGAEGKTLLLLGVLLSAWFFTVPPEFRRSRLCSEAETAQSPDACMTVGQFGSRVKDYYANGGGVKWDFSIAKETKDYFDR